jgi:Transposase DDE domain
VALAPLADRRVEPRCSTRAVVKAALVMFLARLPSLNAVALTKTTPFWKQWLHEPLPSADTLGRVHAELYATGLRQAIYLVYAQLKRNKALPDHQGIGVAVLDGHEHHASFRRHCPGCLERTLHTEHGDRLQYYHRQVTLMLLPTAPPGRPAVRFLLDQEPQRSGEDEVQTALRLLERILTRFPRAFDLVLGDALYATAPYFNFLLARRKHALVVLKDERRGLYQDVTGLLAHCPPQPGRYRGRPCEWWDFSGLLSWPQVQAPVRVLRSRETYTVRRQLDQREELCTSDWMWVTTLPAQSVPTQRVVGFGHLRWDIENYAFNELVQDWHSDHVFRHDPNAIDCFLLVVFLAYDLFHAFFALNLKPAARQRRTQIFWARLMTAELLSEIVIPNRSP